MLQYLVECIFYKHPTDKFAQPIVTLLYDCKSINEIKTGDRGKFNLPQTQQAQTLCIISW